MNYDIPHAFKPKIFVPWAAIPGNIAFMSDKGSTVTTSDGFVCAVKKWKEVHILSQDAVNAVSDLYRAQVMPFLRQWFARIPQMDTMWFVMIELKKLEIDETAATDASALPGEDNTSDNGVASAE